MLDGILSTISELDDFIEEIVIIAILSAGTMT